MMHFKRTGIAFLSVLLLSGCNHPVASPLPAPPSFSEIGGEDMLEKMDKAIAGAKGMRSDWLIEYAGTAESYRREALTCQAFVKLERLP